jgi:hypothetical protein
MLRIFVLLLILANGLYFVWSQGFLRALDFAPAQQSEPQRLKQQIRPENLQILKSDEVKRPENSPQAAIRAAECLQAGLFDDKQSAALRVALQNALPAGSWALDSLVEPGRWIIYMGKYPDADALAKKRGELASLNLKFEPLTNPALEMGLSLGGFEGQPAAEAALAALNRRGVRTARVVQERPELRGALLKVAAVDDALKARLDDLKPALVGKPLRACT